MECSKTSLFLFHPHHRDLRKSFLESRRFQLGAHAAHHVFGYNTFAPLIPFQANFQRDIEEHSLNFVSIVMSEFDPALALVWGKVGGVHVIQGTARDQSSFQHGAQVGENQILEALLSGIVK
jgi:hypothetical protein